MVSRKRSGLKFLSDFILKLVLVTITHSPRLPSQSVSLPYDNLSYPNNTLQAALLVQRDVSLDIPINHILLPGINLTSSWFWTKQYSLENINTITTLFSMGYRRFELDIWWNNGTTSFQLCPTQIVVNSTANSTTTVVYTLSQESPLTASSLNKDRNTTVTRTSSASVTTSPSLLNPTTPIVLPNNYSCAPAANFKAVLEAITSALVTTDDQLENAGVFILVLNLRTLPLTVENNTLDISIASPDALSDQIHSKLGNWLYTPGDLANERQNVNNSFLKDTTNPDIDVTAYYNLIFNASGTASTPDGWPSTRHLFELQGRRLLVGFGAVDVLPDSYDISRDSAYIFPPATFGAQDRVIPSPSVSNGIDSCSGPPGLVFGSSGVVDFSSIISTGNNSFAMSGGSSSSEPLSYKAIQGIVDCGLSPLIDLPLQNTNSGALSPYNPISMTVWSWHFPLEPKNTTFPSNDTNDVFACAALRADSGRWVVRECNTQLSIACRANGSLYSWQIGDESSYYQAAAACPKGTAFSVPHTPVENRHLLSAIRKANVKSVWIDLNSLKAPDCWTIGDSDCPYSDTYSRLREQKVLVPIIASILVIIVFALMCLVKWQRYWHVRAARKRRRLVKGFLEYADYEGIPA